MPFLIQYIPALLRSPPPATPPRVLALCDALLERVGLAHGRGGVHQRVLGDRNGTPTWDQLRPVQQAYERQQDPKRTDWSTWGERKLVAVMSAKQIWVDGNTLRWYLDHGLQVTNVTKRMRFKALKCFAPFVKTFAKRRLEATLAERPLEANMSKKLPCDSWGKQATNPRLYTKTRSLGMDEHAIYREVNKPTFRSLREYQAGASSFAVVESVEREIKETVPVHSAFFVLAQSKLRMLRILYDFVFKYVPEHRVQVLFSDTDSIYLALAHELPIPDEQAVDELGTYVPEHLRPAYLRELYASPASPGGVVDARLYVPETQSWKTYSVERTVCSEEDKRTVLEDYSPVCKDCKKCGKTHCLHSKRWKEVDPAQRYTPGWLAWEWRGIRVTSTTSKSYEKEDWEHDCTRKAKGIRKGLIQGATAYTDVLETGKTHTVRQGTLVVDPTDRAHRTLVQTKKALTWRYTKGYLLDDYQSVAP